MEKKKISRRQFISNSAMIGTAGAIGSATAAGGLLTSCTNESNKGRFKLVESDIPVVIPEMGDKAIDGKPLRAAMIGCGNRGSGAAMDFLDAANDVTITSMVDIFPDRLERLRARLAENRNIIVSDDKIHYGFDAYKKACDDPDIDIVLIASPGVFHSLHVKYAIEKGKQVFCEKPAGICPVTCREFLAAVKMAQAKGLCIQTGAQRNHLRGYIEAYRRVRGGMIGRITGGVLKWNQGAMNYVLRRPEWSDMEYMLRDFFSWNWLCGDHVIDQLVHQIDIFTWFSHLKPVSVVGMGSQLQRRTGDIFDNFALDIVYEGGVRVNAQARQIDNCAGDVSETIIGTEGTCYCKDNGTYTIHDWDGNLVWQYDVKAEEEQFQQRSGYKLEHIDLINHIRQGKSLTLEAERLVTSSLTGAMGRESAYTGKEIKWDEFLVSDLSLMPAEVHLGNIPDFATKFVAPKMGTLAALPGQPRQRPASTPTT
ncbi:MAG: Gfo/Idh/MocA family oxidoreductase [Tannerella sp.]|jgi:predicted dehydrogenase|nr:Gfo/Idh/MocA family oxidoreductase [Tannerella sp.]